MQRRLCMGCGECGVGYARDVLDRRAFRITKRVSARCALVPARDLRQTAPHAIRVGRRGRAPRLRLHGQSLSQRVRRCCGGAQWHARGLLRPAHGCRGACRGSLHGRCSAGTRGLARGASHDPHPAVRFLAPRSGVAVRPRACAGRTRARRSGFSARVSRLLVPVGESLFLRSLFRTGCLSPPLPRANRRGNADAGSARSFRRGRARSLLSRGRCPMRLFLHRSPVLDNEPSPRFVRTRVGRAASNGHGQTPGTERSAAVQDDARHPGTRCDPVRVPLHAPRTSDPGTKTPLHAWCRFCCGDVS